MRLFFCRYQTELFLKTYNKPVQNYFLSMTIQITDLGGTFILISF